MPSKPLRMILTVDAGNTRTKAAVFQGETLVSVSVFRKDEAQNGISELLRRYAEITAIVLASVTHEGKDAFSGYGIPVHIIDRNQVFPFQNIYATPKTLGIDRIVLASGATLAFPGKNRLVIDAGTCITYDFIDDRDRYHGGAISPGLRLRYEALHRYTAKLPLLETQLPESLVGNSTASSIHSGVVNGLLAEIDGFISGIASTGNFIIILTGGDGDFLAKRLKNTIFAHSNFLLESLNRTFQYVKHD